MPMGCVLLALSKRKRQVREGARLEGIALRRDLLEVRGGGEAKPPGMRAADAKATSVPGNVHRAAGIRQDPVERRRVPHPFARRTLPAPDAGSRRPDRDSAGPEAVYC